MKMSFDPNQCLPPPSGQTVVGQVSRGQGFRSQRRQEISKTVRKESTDGYEDSDSDQKQTER